MPQDDVQPHEELVRSSSSMLSLDIVQSNESVSSRSSRISSEQSFRQYIDLPQLEPLELTSREPFLDEVLVGINNKLNFAHFVWSFCFGHLANSCRLERPSHDDRN